MLIRSITSLSVATMLLTGLLAGENSVRAEQGLPSNSTLSAMGISSIALISDADAMAIRGSGYQPHYNKPSATAYGSSYAAVAGYGGRAYSEDGFYASGTHRASGAHGSLAVLIVKHGRRRGGGGGGVGGGGGGVGGGGGGYGGGGHGGGHGHNPRPRPKKIIAFAGGFSFSSTD